MFDEWVNSFAAWLLKNAAAAGYVILAVLGGVVAHIRVYEDAHPRLSLSDHFAAVFRRATMALLAGFMWYLIMLQNGWESQPYAYAGASLVGLFASEFFDFLWSVLKKRVGGAVPDDNH